MRIVQSLPSELKIKFEQPKDRLAQKLPSLDRVRGRAPSITKTERRRSANLRQMPRGLMCKPRQRGRGYGGPHPAGSRGIDPSLHPPAAAARPFKAVTFLLIGAQNAP